MTLATGKDNILIEVTDLHYDKWLFMDVKIEVWMEVMGTSDPKKVYICSDD